MINKMYYHYYIRDVLENMPILKDNEYYKYYKNKYINYKYLI